MGDIIQLVPTRQRLECNALLQSVGSSEGCHDSLSELALEFFSTLGQYWMRSPKRREFPNVVAAAYWLRRSHLEKLVQDFRDSLSADTHILPRGLAFHVAPSNVDVMFLYSWALSVLAGNRNIVRLSTRTSHERDFMLEGINAVLEEPRFACLANSNRIVSYKRSDSISQALVAHADIRIVWGGDDTVQYFRQLRARPHTKDVVFVDKRSFAVLCADSIVHASDDALNVLAQAFCRDSYEFGQAACSSPHYVFFVGDNAAKASELFWRKVGEEVSRRAIVDDTALAMQKLRNVYQDTAQLKSVTKVSTLCADAPQVVRVDDFQELSGRDVCTGGYFYEIFLEELANVLQWITPQHQTMSYYGLEKEVLSEFIQSTGARGLDRAVPCGQALDFNVTWDGYHLLNEFTRRVILQ